MSLSRIFFFFNDTATTEIYTLSLHDALPISGQAFAAGLVAQDVQDALLEEVGRWPLCPLCADATHALYIHPEIGGPDPVWVCEETAREVAPLGSLSRPTR